jgi:hypothetical protein
LVYDHKADCGQALVQQVNKHHLHMEHVPLAGHSILFYSLISPKWVVTSVRPTAAINTSYMENSYDAWIRHFGRYTGYGFDTGWKRWDTRI